MRRGLPVGVIASLNGLGLTVDELAKLMATSRRAINRFLGSKDPDSRLGLSISDRALRVATMLLALGENLLGSHERLLRWMRTPNRYMHDDTPTRAVETDFGPAHAVASIYAVAHGGIA